MFYKNTNSNQWQDGFVDLFNMLYTLFPSILSYLFSYLNPLSIQLPPSATVYGLGTYFAVKASYSANPTYSCPEADGTQLMFVARVLTGSYTLGQRDMKVPPPFSPQQPNIRFDSLVDDQQNPSMFVVFHDSQAYPDYLITFK